MEAQTYTNAIAANAVLLELIHTLRFKGVIGDDRGFVIDAARKLNQTKDPVFEEAAKAVLALYKW